jgi:hypothetical protein
VTELNVDESGAEIRFKYLDVLYKTRRVIAFMDLMRQFSSCAISNPDLPIGVLWEEQTSAA